MTGRLYYEMLLHILCHQVIVNHLLLLKQVSSCNKKQTRGAGIGFRRNLRMYNMELGAALLGVYGCVKELVKAIQNYVLNAVE